MRHGYELAIACAIFILGVFVIACEMNRGADKHGSKWYIGFVLVMLLLILTGGIIHATMI